MNRLVKEGNMLIKLLHQLISFNTKFYLDNNEDVKKAGINPLLHYLLYGKREGRLCMPRKIQKQIFLNPFKRKDRKPNICVLVPGGKEKGESSTYIRLIYPFEQLNDKVNVTIMPLAFKLDDVKEFDICIIQRNAIDDLDKIKKILTLLNENSVKLVVDNDDALGITNAHKNNPYMIKMQKIMDVLLNNADMIWYSTHQLAEFYNVKKCDKQYVIPNALNEKLWSNKKLVKKEVGKKIKFVYMGTSTHDDDFYSLIYPAFQKLHQVHANSFELTIIGSVRKRPEDKWIKFADLPERFIKYPEFVEWFLDNSDFDVGLSPLVDNDFNNCKTDIKFLDYLAIGCVPMLSDVRAYSRQDIVEYAIVVDNNKWHQELVKIIQDRSILDNKRNMDSFSYLWKERSLLKNSKFIHEKLKSLYSINEANYDCLISCWLGVEDVLVDGLVALNKSLLLKGISNSFLVSGPVIEDKLNTVLSSNVEFCPAIISKGFYTEHCFNGEVNEKLEMLRSIDMLWTKRNQDIKVIASVYMYWKEYILNHKVKHMLIWGNTAPMSQLFIMLCTELDVEYSIIERGHFSGTLLVDSVGQFAFGNKQKQLEVQNVELLSERYKKYRMQEIITWINQDVASQYAEKNQKETVELTLIRDKKKIKKVVLFLGANDLGSGMKDVSMTSRSNTWFNSTQDALDSLVKVLPNKFDDVILVIKPHPSAALIVSEELSQDDYIMASNTSIVELIKSADVCVTSASTVLAYCVALGKPTMQFGLTDSTHSKEIYDIWHPSVIASYLRDALGEQFHIEKNEGYSDYVLNLFDKHLIKVNDDVPTKLSVENLSDHLFKRVHQGVSSYEYSIIQKSAEISRRLFEDVVSRERKRYDLSLTKKINSNDLPELAIVIPVYDDLVGLKRCVECAIKFRHENNNYQIVLVWDCGPREETLAYCREVKDKCDIDLIENRVNVGFSGTVNKGILKYKEHDIILLNSDTIVHSDWAIRMQKAAYVDKQIGSVNPLSNNATINNVPFPNGTPFPKKAINFVNKIDALAKMNLNVAIEIPVSHGFCVFIKRSIIDIIGLFDEQKFGKGHGEDNEYSMRIRSKGFSCVATTNVYIGHDGSTSFKEDVMFWKLNGRAVMGAEFPFYMEEIKHFFNNDPIAEERNVLEPYISKLVNKTTLK
jgi:GT2 family glycosyltransferase